MRKLKWAFILFAVISIISCSSDDDSGQIQLMGTWHKVYDDTVTTKKYVQYDFIPNSLDDTSRGVCNIVTRSSFNRGSVITRGEYVFSDNNSRLLYIFMQLDNGHMETRGYELKFLSDNEIELLLVDSDEVLKLRK